MSDTFQPGDLTTTRGPCILVNPDSQGPDHESPDGTRVVVMNRALNHHTECYYVMDASGHIGLAYATELTHMQFPGQEGTTLTSTDETDDP